MGRGNPALPAMQRFRTVMFERLVPNLEYIGLMSDRIKEHYDKSGLTRYLGGKNATQLTEDDLTAEQFDDELPQEARELVTAR